MRFGLEVRIVAVEPIDTPMGFEVCLFQNAPDAGATHDPWATLLKSGHQIIEAPAGGGAVVRRGGRVADLHFTRMCAMLLTASEGEHHGTHTRAVSPLSQRPSHQRRQD